MKLSAVNKSIQRVQQCKTQELDTLDRLYRKQSQVYEQIGTLESKLELMQQQKDAALEKEDYMEAETLQIQEQKMTVSLAELQEQHLLTNKIYAAWQHVASLEKQEADYAEQLIESCKAVKEERSTRHMKFVQDIEKMDHERLLEIEEQRAKIESEKSEVAFDMGLWEQAEEDLAERQADAIHEEEKKKQFLEGQHREIQVHSVHIKEKTDL